MAFRSCNESKTFLKGHENFTFYHNNTISSILGRFESIMVGMGDCKIFAQHSLYPADEILATGDQWNEMAKAYKRITTDTSVRPIGVMLERANALSPFSEATSILDNGCGPGPVMTRLLKDYQIPESCSLTCSDFSEGMVKQVENIKQEAVKADAQSPWNRVETVVQDAMDLKSIEDSSKSHVTAGWVRSVENTQASE